MSTIFPCTDELPNRQLKRLLVLLLRVASNELLTHQIYACLREATQFDSLSGLSDLLHSACIEDLEHYREILVCIKRLNGGSNTAIGYAEVAQLKGREHKVQDLLRILRATEESSVKAYTEICTITLEYDYRTFDLSYRNLHENIHHQHMVVRVLLGEFPVKQLRQRIVFTTREFA